MGDVKDPGIRGNKYSKSLMKLDVSHFHHVENLKNAGFFDAKSRDSVPAGLDWGVCTLSNSVTRLYYASVSQMILWETKEGKGVQGTMVGFSGDRKRGILSTISGASIDICVI